MYECHITIEPVLDEDRLTMLRHLCEALEFKVSKLYMIKTDEQSTKDTFVTGRDGNMQLLTAKMRMLDKALTRNGFKVWRRKIELIILDERVVKL